MKCLLKNLGQIQCAKLPQRLSRNQDFFNTLAWRKLCPSSYTFSSTKTHSKVLEQSKEMTFDRRPANISRLLLRSLCCPSSQNV